LIDRIQKYISFFDKDIIKNYRILPLDLIDENLIVGICRNPDKKIKKALEELIPFNISFKKISEKFFNKKIKEIFYIPQTFEVSSRKKLLFPYGKDYIKGNMSEEDFLRYLLAIMIKKEKRFIVLKIKGNYIENEKIHDMAFFKIKKLLMKNYFYNPLPIKIEDKKLYLYFRIQNEKGIYLEIFPENIWAEQIQTLISYLDENTLVILGKQNIKKSLFVNLLCKTLNGRNAFLSRGFWIKFPEYKKIIYEKISFEKTVEYYRNGDFDYIFFDEPFSLYYIFLKYRDKKIILSLSFETKKEFIKEIKKEKLEPALKEAFKSLYVFPDFEKYRKGEITGYKLKLKNV